MKFELNFLPDIPTVNGRIYQMEDLKEVFKKVDIPVTSFPIKPTAGLKGDHEPSVTVVPERDIIGYANLSELSADKIEFDVTPVKQMFLDAAEGKQLTISALGEVKRVDIKDECGLITESKQVVTDLQLINLFVALENNIEK